MTDFEGADLTGARFRKVQLNDADFRMVDLSGAVVRDADLTGVTIDGCELDGFRVDGVEIAPLVEAELERRQPARALRRASDPDGLRAAWAAVEAGWAQTYERAAALPDAALDESVRGEWSFNQTLRHLVFVTDAWFGATQDGSRSYHPWGLPFAEAGEFVDLAEFGLDESAAPTSAQVRQLRAQRVADVREFLATVTPEQLAVEVAGPAWAGEEPVSVLRCLRVVLNEECEHQRFAERDLATLAG